MRADPEHPGRPFASLAWEALRSPGEKGQASDEGPSDSSAQPELDDLVDQRPERTLVCTFCHHEVTSPDQRTQVDGAHEHRFMNPHGYLYDIGCFREAPGCRLRGEPSTEFAWFPGFAWTFAACGGCTEHLGWRFDSAGSSFYGLVLNRLVEIGEAGEGGLGDR